MTDAWLYELTDHTCRSCLGRIIKRGDVFMCSSCETMCAQNPDGICGCGMRSATSTALPIAVKGAFRCGVNPARSMNSPARIVILYGGQTMLPVVGS